MKYDFANRIKKHFINDKAIKIKYGRLYKKIKACISVIEFVDNLSEVPEKPPTRRHKLSNKRWALDLDENWRFIILPIEGNKPEEIKDIIFEKIEDYH